MIEEERENKERNLYFRSFILYGVVRPRADDEGQAKYGE